MKLDRVIRIALAALILVVFLVATGALLFVTESALNVWDRLAEGPRFLLYIYAGLLVGIILGAIWLIWRFVIRRPIAAPAPAEPLTRDDIESRLRGAEEAGVDVEAAQAELQELARRREGGGVHLCFFGEVSTGEEFADQSAGAGGGRRGRRRRWFDGGCSPLSLARQ